MKKTSLLVQPDYFSFEKVISENFSFLDSDYGFRFSGVREENEGPRDQGVVARYSDGETRVEIGWSATEGSLVVLIKTKTEGLTSADRYIYFEPFVEFFTQGKVKPLCPQIYPGMAIRRIEEAMEQRKKYFQDGIVSVIEILASRFREYFPIIKSATIETRKQYQEWYRSRGQLSK